MKRTALCLSILVGLFLNGGFAARALTDDLTPEERRGKQIYLRGSSESGREITATIGDDSGGMAAAAVPCASCHGLGGEGKTESGITSSDITWDALTKPYGTVHVTGRRHPAYSEKTVERAIMAGIDPAGNQLLVAMPRFHMHQKDIADLIAYLKRIGKECNPGLTETSIRVGTIVPPKGPLAENGQVIRDVMAAYFNEVNQWGGIYNRKIELQVAESAETPAETRQRVGVFLQRESIFAMVGALIAGADKEVVSLLEGKEVPLVGPFTFLPQAEYPLNRHIFYLLSGIKEQARALVKFADKNLRTQNVRLAIVYPENEISTEVSLAIEKECKKTGFSSPLMFGYPKNRFDAARLVMAMSQSNVSVIFFLGGKELAALVAEAERLRWTPNILSPGSLASPEMLDALLTSTGNAFLSFPTLPLDQTQSALAEYFELARKYKLSSRHLASQISAYCAARVLIEGLKLAGKDLSREKLITSLEGFYEFKTGLIPPITYGPDRRIGTLGTYVVRVDRYKRQFAPAGDWIDIH